jgi:putative transposase
LPFTSEAR